jgi:hypothetical protein
MMCDTNSDSNHPSVGSLSVGALERRSIGAFQKYSLLACYFGEQGIETGDEGRYYAVHVRIGVVCKKQHE